MKNIIKKINDCVENIKKSLLPRCIHKWTLYRGHYYVDNDGNRHVVVRCNKCGAMMTSFGVLRPEELISVKEA